MINRLVLIWFQLIWPYKVHYENFRCRKLLGDDDFKKVNNISHLLNHSTSWVCDCKCHNFLESIFVWQKNVQAQCGAKDISRVSLLVRKDQKNIIAVSISLLSLGEGGGEGWARAKAGSSWGRDERGVQQEGQLTFSNIFQTSHNRNREVFNRKVSSYKDQLWSQSLIVVFKKVEQKVERLRQTEASLEKRIEREQAEVDKTYFPSNV